MATPTLASLAEDFITIGGRLMGGPKGRFESAINIALLFERTWPDPEEPEPFVARRIIATASMGLSSRDSTSARLPHWYTRTAFPPRMAASSEELLIAKSASLQSKGNWLWLSRYVIKDGPFRHPLPTIRG